MRGANAQIEVVEIEPFNAPREFWDRYHVFRRFRHQEVQPEDPVDADAVVEGQLSAEFPTHELHWFVLEDGPKIAGEFWTYMVKPSAPAYESGKHVMIADAALLPQYRRRGVGSRFARMALEIMEGYGASILSVRTQEEAGHAFLQWLGAQEKQVQADNRLDFTKVDWEMMRTWVEEGRLKSPQTRFEFYQGRLPEEEWEDYSQALTEFLNTMPFDDMAHGDIVVTPGDMRDRYERFDVMGITEFTYLTREPDGTISGMTDVTFTESKPTHIEQQFTGVRPRARGRGLGKLLKASMLLFIRDRFPATTWIRTGNAATNEAMLAINLAIGFRQHRQRCVYQISADDLRSRLARSV